MLVSCVVDIISTSFDIVHFVYLKSAALNWTNKLNKNNPSSERMALALRILQFALMFFKLNFWQFVSAQESIRTLDLNFIKRKTDWRQKEIKDEIKKCER